jgi:hypothetical protein
VEQIHGRGTSAAAVVYSFDCLNLPLVLDVVIAGACTVLHAAAVAAPASRQPFGLREAVLHTF